MYSRNSTFMFTFSYTLHGLCEFTPDSHSLLKPVRVPVTHAIALSVQLIGSFYDIPILSKS